MLSPSGWTAAESVAVSIGGHLATINDAAEDAWVVSTFGSYLPVWIGLNDRTTEGTYVWTSGEPVSYLNWRPGEPNNSGNEDLVYLGSNGWNDYCENRGGCDALYGLVEVPTACPDSDGDGVTDASDACPGTAIGAAVDADG